MPSSWGSWASRSCQMACSSSTKWGENFTSITRRGRGEVDGIFPHHPSGTGTDQNHPVGQGDGLGEVVGDIENGGAGALPHRQDIVLKALAGKGVQGGEGLVHHQDGGVHRQHPGDGGPLFHAAGELPGIVVLKACQPHFFPSGPGRSPGAGVWGYPATPWPGPRCPAPSARAAGCRPGRCSPGRGGSPLAVFPAKRTRPVVGGI